MRFLSKLKARGANRSVSSKLPRMDEFKQTISPHDHLLTCPAEMMVTNAGTGFSAASMVRIPRSTPQPLELLSTIVLHLWKLQMQSVLSEQFVDLST